jgi:hypothetical protein
MRELYGLMCLLTVLLTGKRAIFKEKIMKTLFPIELFEMNVAKSVTRQLK